MDVRRSGGAYTGYSWTVIFNAPRDDLEAVHMNATNVVAVNVTSKVTTMENGSNSTLWFMPIPAWMTEVPVSTATRRRTRGNVEVFVKTQQGDVLKAVVDNGQGSTTADPAAGYFSGDEMTAAFEYSSAATAIVSSFRKHTIDAVTTGIEVFGSSFVRNSVMPGSEGLLAKVTVQLGRQDCNVTFMNATYVACTVRSVPWGPHTPEMQIEGYGKALLSTTSTLFFKQYIYSISPSVGSVAGGQILTIEGRGFRWNATITVGGQECEMLSWSSSSITCRTPAASSYASRQPTAGPSVAPSMAPSEHPSFSPTQEIAQYPSQEPSVFPSVLPSSYSEPTFSPSYDSGAESGDPSFAPTRSVDEEESMAPATAQAFAMQYKEGAEDVVDWLLVSNKINQQDNKRKLQADAPSGNTYPVLVDGIGADDEAISQYHYDDHETPKVFALDPLYVSSASSANITILCESLAETSIVVMVGEQVCEHVKLYFAGYGSSGQPMDFVNCVLKRQPSFGKGVAVPVRIYVPNKGYAALQSDIMSLPVLYRGFEISQVSPAKGSVMGGNVLNITGFGFMGSDPSRHTVTLSQVGLSGLSEYDAMLLALGFSASTTYKASERFNCLPIASSLYNILCRIPAHINSIFNDTIYDVKVSLNNIDAVCQIPSSVDADGSVNCTYAQLFSETPVLTQTLVLDVSMNGEYLVNVSITRENALPKGFEIVEVIVANQLCAVVNSSSSTKQPGQNNDFMMIQTPSLPGGRHLVNATFRNIGAAYATTQLASIQVDSVIHSVEFAASNGSLAGGTTVTITGQGFAENCSKLAVSFDTTYISGEQILNPASQLLSCSTTRVVLKTPSVLWFFQNKKTYYSEEQLQVTVSGIILQAGSASQVSFRLSDDMQSSAAFQYTYWMTPRVVTSFASGASNAVQGSLMSVLVMSRDSLVLTKANDTGYSVTMGDKECTYDGAVNPSPTMSQSDHDLFLYSFHCILPPLAGSSIPYPVLVDINSAGYAIDNSISNFFLPLYTSPFVARTFSSMFGSDTLSSSVYGGRRLTLEGQGFAESTYVSVCEKQCKVSGVRNYSSLTCELPDHMTTEGVDGIVNSGRNLDMITELPGTYFSSLNNPSSSLLPRLNDSNYETYFSHNIKTCFVGVTLPRGYAARPYRMRFYPRIRNARHFGSYIFEGKKVGSSHYTILGRSMGADDGWNFLNADAVNGSAWYSEFRYRAADSSSTNSQCALAELKFLGTLASLNKTCDVRVFFAPDAYQNVTVGKVSYGFSSSTTPIITSLSPSNGSALGGTLLTIYGSGFAPLRAQGKVEVSISGIACSVVSSNDSQISCVTNPRPPEAVEVPTLRVWVEGKGYGLVEDDARFMYIDKWSALTSWRNQEPPVDGDVVWIPDGQVILLDQDTPLLTFLLVEGRLYFDRSKDLKVDSYYILVLGGYMEIGTEKEPFEKKVQITIWGDRYKTVEIPFIGSKFLAVAQRNLPFMRVHPGMHLPSRDQGQLEIHGKKRLRTWTKVSQTAYAGSNYVITAEPVDYAAGEQVVVNGNGLPGQDSYEVMEVLVTSADGHNVTFTKPLQYTHKSEIVHVEGRRIDMRFEIGLLTRNIVIQGDNKTSDGQLYGVHTIAMLSGVYRMENAEIRRCGQAFNFGKYCTHSHMAGMMETSYVKANSIHHSYQRAVTTHDTDDWEVRDNVAFDITGHAYFVEDGSEKRNSITGNLGIMVRRSSALLKSDMKPAVFWTATPYNYWRDNVGSFSVAFGFWFELVGSEEGLCPVNMPLGEFKNNTFHSNGMVGLRIYPQWTPHQNPCDTDSPPAPQYLQTMLSYHNGGNGLFSKKHGDLHHISLTLVENGDDEVAIEKYTHVPYTMDPTFVDVLFIGSLDPNFQDNWSAGKLAILGPQGEYFYVKNSTFVNYGTAGAITGCNKCLGGEDMSQGAFTHRYEQLKFVKTKRRTIWIPPRKEILWDLDGSLAGVADSMLTPYYDYLNWEECTVLPEDQFSGAVRCGGGNSTARIRRMQVESVRPSQLSYTDIWVRTPKGNSEFFFLPLDTYGWVFPVVTGSNKTYVMEWKDAGISAESFNLTLGRDAYLLETMNNPQYDENVKMRHNPNIWDYDPYSFNVYYNSSVKIAPLNNTQTLRFMADSEYKNRSIDVILTNQGAIMGARPKMFGVDVVARLCPPKGCPIPPVPTIGMPMLWSRPASWPNKRVPRTGERVTIESNMWIVLDVSPPRLGALVIYGKLSFLSNETAPLNLTLQVQNIQLYGNMEILGTANFSASPYNTTLAPFVGNATVVVYGAKGSSLPVTMKESAFLGSKVIAITGSLSAWGRDKVQSWVRLNQTATAGSSQVILPLSLSAWSIGDEIVFSPTAYFDSTGKTWSRKTGKGVNDEVRVIQNVTITYFAAADQYQTTIILSKPLNHTHLCEVVQGQLFCGAVGVMTRSVRFVSADSENPTSPSYGFGASMHVIDMPAISPPRYGALNLNNVELKNFGKVNSQHYAIAMRYENYNHPASTIVSCSFNAGYNFAFRAANSYNLTFVSNVALGNWGGGVYIDPSNSLFVVDSNLVIGSRQLPSVLLSSFPWVRPIASFSIHSPAGVVRNNLAAGSEDQGFSVAMATFISPDSRFRALCPVTRSAPLSPEFSSLLQSYSNSQFSNNEAVACRTGLAAVAMYGGETDASDCAVLDGMKVWRSAHVGIQGLDIVPNVLIARSILAENFIGTNLMFFRSSLSAFSGMVQSTVIGSLTNSPSAAGACRDMSDVRYVRGSQCQAFTETDPLGLQAACGSVLADLYRRVGVMVPQFTNRARTCALAGRFAECDPPNTPDRLCMLPMDKRYALPVDMIYAEMHIHNTTFVNFQYRSYDNTSMVQGGECIPSLLEDKSAAIAYNPSQFDMQPTLVTSGLHFVNTDVSARLGHDLGAWAQADNCQYRSCSGHDMMVVHDQDGSMTPLNKAGQLVYKNPAYATPYPSCFEVASVDNGLYLCPSAVEDQDNNDNGDTNYEAGFRQYPAMWRDWGPQMIHPLITTRTLPTENRTFASYGPIDDMCAMRFYFSRFNTLIGVGTYHKLMTTGTIPSEWIFRWDAPSESDVAVLEFFIQQSQAINVFVSNSPYGGFVQVPKITRYPTMDDPAGTNMRDPQRRFLAVTIRGGSSRYYRFNLIPVAAVTIKMEMPLSQFFSNTFIANMAMLLRIDPSRIKITDVRQGSVIADFEVSPAVSVANSSSAVVSQIFELQQVTAN
ncbi:hypothetical protein EON64_00770, partial [archaeon]